MPAASRAPVVVLLLVLLAGCAAPASEGPEGPMAFPGGLVPSTWRPTDGVVWGNMTGPLEPGRCDTMDLREPPPVRASWWLRASPNVTLVIAPWTDRPAHAPLCAEIDKPGVRTLRGVERMNLSEERGDDHPGSHVALLCEHTAPCEVQWWSQIIRHVTDADGTRRWASEPGPAPAGYAG